jgi:photosystem II stability/assembly factor-like uncharacterized protein
MAIGLSHGGSNVYTSPEPSREVLVGTKDGVVTLARGSGSEWTIAGRSLEGRFISSIIVEPTSGTVFAGAFFGSVYASSDGGKTWRRRSWRRCRCRARAGARTLPDLRCSPSSPGVV